jgi:hypothetical protein
MELKGARGKLEDQIERLEFLDTFASSPEGSGLSVSEAQAEYFMNTLLLSNLNQEKRALENILPKMPKSPFKSGLLTDLGELVGGGDNGVGAILTVKEKLDALSHPELTSTGTDPESSALALATARGDLIGQVNQRLIAENLLYKMQYSTLLRAAPFGGNFGGGGTVPGPEGAPRTIIAHGGEAVGERVIEVHLHGSMAAVDARVEKVLIDKIHTAVQTKIIPGQRT